MGFFAFFAGFLYNDFLSISFDFFGSCYDGNKQVAYPGTVNGTKIENTYNYDPDCTYPFGTKKIIYLIIQGLDPIWIKANNEI